MILKKGSHKNQKVASVYSFFGFRKVLKSQKQTTKQVAIVAVYAKVVKSSRNQLKKSKCLRTKTSFNVKLQMCVRIT